MIRRLELAQALVNRPQMLILDEPTIGLDPIARASVWERVEAMRHDRHFAQDEGGLEGGHESFRSVRSTRRTAGRVG